MNSKGQVTIIGLFMIFVTLVAYAGISPVLNTFIDNISAGTDPMTGTLFKLIPTVFVIGLIASIFVYSRPEREIVYR